MAIQLNYSRMGSKKDILLDPTVDQSTLERGMVMVDSGFNAAGERLVAPSAAGSGERVVGFLMLTETKQSTVPLIETLSVPASGPYTITLKNAPAGAAAVCRAYNTATGATIAVVDGALAAGQLGLGTGDGILTADSALASVDFAIVYRYSITAQELARRGGQKSVNAGAEGIYNQVTVIYGICEMTVSNFDTAALLDVAANVVIASGASGRCVLTGGAGTDFGTKTKKVHNDLTPGIEQAFITVECNLPG